MAAARVLLLLSGRPESVGFAQSVCGLLGTGPGPGPWPTHCGWKPGQLLLSDRPFPGASARLPLQVGSRAPAGGAGGRRCRLGPGRETRGRASRPDAASSPSRGVPVFESPFHLGSPNPSAPSHQRPPFCPFAALDQQPRPPGTELPTSRGVDLGVAIILQSSDQTVLLTRRTRTLRVSPNLWVPPGELPEDLAPSPGVNVPFTERYSQSQDRKIGPEMWPVA